MRTGLLFVGLMFSTAVSAQTNTPTIGMLYHTTENSSIVFDCSRVDGVTINCNFNQTSVRRKLSNEDGAKELQKSRSNFASKPDIPKAEECKTYASLLAFLQGKGPLPDQASKAPQLSARQKADMTRFLTSMVAFCQSPTLDNFTKLASIGIEKDKRTCRVSSNRFEQRLRRASANTWTVIPEPEGPCGIVRLDRLEAEPSSGFTFWNYIVRKAVTNPNASAGILSCRQLDEAEYKYDWRRRDLEINCEYIEFSPI